MKSSDIKSLQKRIRYGIERALYPDRRTITGELRLINNALHKGEDGEETHAKLRKLEKKLKGSIRKRESRRKHLPEITYPELPPHNKEKR